MSDLTEQLIALRDALARGYGAGQHDRDAVAEAVNTLTEQEAELDRAQEDVNNNAEISQRYKKVAELAENARLREALEFIVDADPDWREKPLDLAWAQELARAALSDPQEGSE